jgi:hypothetical protein
VYAVINTLIFSEPLDPGVFAGIDELRPRFEAVAGFEAAHVVQTGEREAVLVILAADAAALDRLATEVGSPWMREHVVPLLSGPPVRLVGPVIGSTVYGA